MEFVVIYRHICAKIIVLYCQIIIFLCFMSMKWWKKWWWNGEMNGEDWRLDIHLYASGGLLESSSQLCFVRSDLHIRSYYNDHSRYEIRFQHIQALETKRYNHHLYPKRLFAHFDRVIGQYILICIAFTEGGRWPWLFFAAMCHGFVVEFMAYFAPFIENFWHAQGIVTLFDRRMTLYIVFLCKWTYSCV